MIGEMVIGFRVRHEAEYPAGGIANPGNILNRSIGVMGKNAVCRSAVRQAIAQCDLVVFLQAVDDGSICMEFSLTVADREFEPIHSLCKHTGGVWVSLERYPLVPEVAAIMEGEGNRTLTVIPVKARKQTKIHQGLESIADANNQISFVDKFQKLIADMGL